MADSQKSPGKTRPEKPDAAQAEEAHDRLAQPVDVEEGPRLPFPVVGIGASAGGLEAFIEFFEAMPGNPGIAFVLLQHLPPDRESLIAEIVGKHTSLPVQQVEDGMSVAPDHVYVIRPGHTLTIEGGKLHLGEALQSAGHNRAVDDFFRSLADEQRNRAICIVMSGMGSNGTAGAGHVKAVGGVVIAQDPDSAKHSPMPRHLIDSGNADFVLRPREMPELLSRYVAHPYVSRTEPLETEIEREERRLGDVLAVLRTRTRRDFRGYKKPTVFRRVYRRMGLHQIEDLDEYANFLRENPQEVAALADDLMIRVTGFFRDAEAWETLRRLVIEPLVAERSSGDAIRCWVSACASGEEAYSLCMLLLEAAEAGNKRLDIKMFATDTADRALARARLGVYPLGIEADVSGERLKLFFDRDEALYRIKKELRELVVFAPQNIVQDPPFSRLDICSCRNLLIYLEPEFQRRVLALLHFGLREGGALFLGTSETIAGADKLFEPIDKRARIYRRIGKSHPDAIDFAFRHASAGMHAALGPPTIGQITNLALLHHHTPAAVTVDREGHVVYLHGDTAGYLKQPEGEPTSDLLSLVHESLRDAARIALSKAIAQGKPATARGSVVETSGGRFWLEVSVSPLDAERAPGHTLVSFERHDEPAPGLAEPRFPETDDPAVLRQELDRVRDELQSTIEELQSNNEEMKASAEEAMSMNEELQSTNEELQTSKEELQSVNEELTTVNAQLEAKMLELEAMTSDLASLLSSTDIAVLFLDRRLRIRRFTPATIDLLDLIASDVGRPLSDMARKFDDPELLGDCQAVLDKLIPVEKEITSFTGRVYMRRITAYRTSDNRIDGVVVTFIDISKRRHAERALESSEARFRLVIDNAPDFAMLLMDVQGRIVTWNVGAERLLGWSKEEASGKLAAVIYPPETGPTQMQRELERAAEFGRAADECWHVRKAGSRFWGSGVLTAVRDADGHLTGFVKVLRDDTARKQAEGDRTELLQREKAARQEAEIATDLKDQFLVTLSHELRTPLSTILVWAKILREQRCDQSERDEGIKIIEKNAEAQKQLLDDLLDTARIAAGKVRLERTNIDLLSVVRPLVDAIVPVAKEKQIAVHAELADGLGKIYADADRLSQVVSNLLTNAVKFTPSGGRVDVRLSTDDTAVELVVADTGQGIDPEFLSRIFTPFSQADASSARAHGGLGLGLAICKDLVELHGGTVRAESAGVGKGARFVVRLPRFASPQPPEGQRYAPSSESAGRDSLQGAKILLVEDEPQTRDALVKLLGKAGATMTAVATAAEGMQAFNQSPPDLIISDIGLPEESGYELMQRIRSQEMDDDLPATPAIALTAFAGSKDRHQARESGFHKHIAKPVTPAALLAAVSTLLTEKDRAENGG